MAIASIQKTNRFTGDPLIDDSFPTIDKDIPWVFDGDSEFDIRLQGEKDDDEEDAEEFGDEDAEEFDNEDLEDIDEDVDEDFGDINEDDDENDDFGAADDDL